MSASHVDLSAQFVVIATGTKSKYATDKKICTEVYHLRDIKGKLIDIVGAGDAAFDYAMTLSAHNKVTVLNKGTKIRCVPALFEIAQKQANITYVENSNPGFSSDYTIFATGRKPELGCLSAELEENRQQLEQQGLLYIIGDVKNGMVRQASVAIGDGIRAAMAIREKIISE